MDVRYDLPLEGQNSQWIGNFRTCATTAEVRVFVEALLELAQPPRNPADGGST